MSYVVILDISPFSQVVLLVLEVHACIAKDPQNFHQLVVFLVDNFRVDTTLLEKWAPNSPFLPLLFDSLLRYSTDLISVLLCFCFLICQWAEILIQLWLSKFSFQAWGFDSPPTLCSFRCWKSLSGTLHNTWGSMWFGFCVNYGPGLSLSWILIIKEIRWW